MNDFQTTKIWKKTLKTLKLISAATDHSLVETVERLASQEWARIQVQEKRKMIGKVRVTPRDEQGHPLPYVLVDKEISHRFVAHTPNADYQYGFIEVKDGKYAKVRQHSRTLIWDIILRNPVEEAGILQEIQMQHASWEWITEVPFVGSAEYDAEELWNVQAALNALRTMGESLTKESVAWWLNRHSGEEHAYGEFGPVDEAKVEAIMQEAGNV